MSTKSKAVAKKTGKPASKSVSKSAAKPNAKPAPKPFDMSKAVGSLASRLTEAQPGEKIVKLPIGKVAPNPKQHRKHFDKAALLDLGNSIKETRQEQPIGVRPNDDPKQPYIIIFGERRWRACGLVGLPTVDAVVRQIAADDEEAILLAEANENEQRENLTMAERISLVVSLVDRFGLTVAAKRHGKPKPRVSRMYSIGTGDPMVMECLNLGFAEDIETLHRFALLVKEAPKVAKAMFEGWKADPDSAIALRRQIDKAREGLKDPTPADAAKDGGRAGGSPAHQNAGNVTEVDRGSSGVSSASHSVPSGGKPPSDPAVRPSDAGASSGRPAAGQRSESADGKRTGGSVSSPSSGSSPSPGKSLAEVFGGDPAGEDLPPVVAVSALYEDDIIVVKTSSGTIRFDRKSLTDVLGLNG